MGKLPFMKKSILVLSLIFTLVLGSQAMAEPATEQTIREFLLISESLERAEEKVDKIVENWRLIDPSLPDRFYEDLKSELGGENLIAALVPAYKNLFKEEDLRLVNTFFRTDAGQSYLRAMVKVKEEVGDARLRLRPSVADELFEKYQID
jgi:uncharacterized protein